jgi:hypothetical protein
LPSAVSPGSNFLAVVCFQTITDTTSGILMAGKTFWSNTNGFMFDSKTNTDTLEINGGDGSTFPALSVPTVGKADGLIKTLVIQYRGTKADVFMNGRAYGTVTIAAAGTWPSGLGIGDYSASNSQNADRKFYFGGVIKTGDPLSISANPWQIFQPISRPVFYSLPSAAGILFDAASNSGYQAAQSTYTFNRTVTGSNTFLAVDVELLSVPGTTVTSVVDDSGGGNVSMSFIGAKSTISGAGRVESWGLVAPATGTKSIQVNLSASIASAATAVSYTGVHQTTPTEAFNSAQATNVGAADATVSITSIADNTWIHGACVTDDTAITANQTTRNNVTGALGSGADEDTGPVTPAGVTAVSYTNVDALKTWAIAGYAIRPLAASGGGTIFNRRSMGARVGSRSYY